MRVQLLGLCFATAALAACSGGGGGSAPPVSGGGGGGSSAQSSNQTANEQAVATTNGVGTPLLSFANYEQSISTSSSGAASSARSAAASAANGTCSNGREFFAPDTAGNANSTETKLFYDSACTELARDIVRIYTSTGAGSETVQRTESLYAPNNATAIATRTSNVAIANATFDQNGFAIAQDGFTRSDTAQLTIGNSRVISSGGELVMQASTSGTNDFCHDSAGYSVTGSPTLGETFGWAGGVLSGGTRTVNGNGTVTWTATHAGTAYKAPIGGLSLSTGTLNTTCPITTPAFTLSGGTAIGTYSIPVVATYHAGLLVNLSVTNATLSDGYTLNITTTPGALQSSNTFIVGTIASGSTQISTFAVDAFGDGTLTVTKTGAQFVITDWHVIR